MSLEITRYDASMKQTWDEAVAASRNATFLLRRDYMDYHSDRFADHSLVVTDDSGRIAALLPACVADEGRVLASHPGLTYGGLILPSKHSDATRTLAVVEALADYCRKQGFKALRYKAIPHFYHRLPSEDDVYALWRCGATVEAVQVSSTIDLLSWEGCLAPYRRDIAACTRHGVTVEQSDDFEAFWGILAECLSSRHEVRPVHSLDEMRLLASRFPDNIKLYIARDAAAKPIAGTVVYLTGVCVHSQYIGSTPEARRMRSLPLLINRTIEDAKAGGARYYDIGTNNEDGGRVLNAGLVEQKKSFGAMSTVYTTYLLKF